MTYLQRLIGRPGFQLSRFWHDIDTEQAGIGVNRHRLRRLPGPQRQQELLVALIALAAVGLGTATTGAVTAGAPAPPAAAATEETVDTSDRAGAADRADRSDRSEGEEAESQESEGEKAESQNSGSEAAESQESEGERAESQNPEGAESDGKEASSQAEAQEKAPRPAWVHPMPGAATTSCFGPRAGVLHAGVDLASPPGTPIRAVGAGTVTAAGWAFPGYGISVMINHGNGYYTHYAHASAAKVSVGDRVEPGDVIALEGSTGDSSGPHLHFEVHKGMWNQVEPTRWMSNRDVGVGGC